MTEPSTESQTWVAPAEFRALMAGFPSGVTVVTTTGPGDRPAGMTCSAVCSVSLRPPILLVCLRRGSPTLDAILWRGTFALNLLHAAARPVAQLFASGAPDRFDNVRWRCGTGRGGPHLLDHAHAVADCQVERAERMGDHTVVFGRVFGISGSDEPRPLLYGLHTYAPWPGR